MGIMDWSSPNGQVSFVHGDCASNSSTTLPCCLDSGLHHLTPVPIYPATKKVQDTQVNTCAVGLAGVQLEARIADTSVSIWEIHTGSRATDVGGSSSTSINACRRQSRAEVLEG